MTLGKLLRWVFLGIVLLSAVIAIIHPDKGREAIDANNQGLDIAKQGDLNGAIADYDKAIQLDPKLEAAFVNRASAKDDKGDLAGAIADYDQALLLDPNDSVAYNNR